jgi:hypothetical protein
MDSKINGIMNQYLDKVYGNLDCLVSEETVTWHRNGKMIAGVSKGGNPGRLRLGSSEFNSFRNIFSLPWDVDDDNIILLELIVPHLKFNGGTPAIPVLVDMGFIGKLNHIALPSNW